MEKIDSRTLPVAALNERRRRAVKMRLDGVSLKDAAAQCEMSRTTLIAAVKAYRAGGWKALDVERPGRPQGTGRTLTAEQEREVQRLIRDRTPDQLKMIYALWSRQAVAELILNRYGIKLAVRTMGLYLERWGFTPQKPMKKAYEQSPAAVKKWLDEDYPVIAACAKAEGAEIHWGDETGVRRDDVRGHSYAPQGQTPVIRVNNKRHGLSVISTVTNKGQMRWQAFDGALSADILIDFLRRLVKDAGRKIYLILYNLRVHHSKPVKAWQAEHKHEIEVFYLPSYSPELSPNEMANADLKQVGTKLAPTRSKLQLVKASRQHLLSVQRQPERVKSYFEHAPDQ
ncbi:MAG: IS630 family transposase [Candidatus Protistobacter heckmanni]|nr:IS630 family transposase [Candidatus Protistobacter heckmanni]